MDLVEAIVHEPVSAQSIDDLVDINGILTTVNAKIERIRDPLKIPSQTSSLNACKMLFNYKLNRKKVEESESEESEKEIESENDESVNEDDSAEEEEIEEELEEDDE